MARLEEVAIDCLHNIKCTDNAHGRDDKEVWYGDNMVRDQAIYGIYDKEIQAKIFAKGSKLLGLEAMVTQAEAEEQAKITQNKLGTASATAEVNKVSAFSTGCSIRGGSAVKTEHCQETAYTSISGCGGC